jgi:hypothetical protein
MEKQQAISYLRHDFPELAEPGNTRVEEFSDAISDVHRFARLVGDLLAHEDMPRVQRAFDLIEDFLRAGGAELRNWVCSYLESLQDIANWSPSGSDVFLRFLGSETRRAWSALEAIRRDLDNYSTLEAEVLMWRISHSRADRPVSSRAA